MSADDANFRLKYPNVRITGMKIVHARRPYTDPRPGLLACGADLHTRKSWGRLPRLTYTARPITCSQPPCAAIARSDMTGHAISGRTSDRLRAGEIEADLKFKGNDSGTEPEATPSSVKRAAGYGLGKGAERRRNGGAS